MYGVFSCEKTVGNQALIGRFETACIAWIPLIAEFGTDHIEKAVFVTSASIFSETVGGMKLKFGEEIEKKTDLWRSVAIQVRFSVFLR